jgi:hypothetical protein
MHFPRTNQPPPACQSPSGALRQNTHSLVALRAGVCCVPQSTAVVPQAVSLTAVEIRHRGAHTGNCAWKRRCTKITAAVFNNHGRQVSSHCYIDELAAVGF